jgi:hypothetical protein
MEELSASLKVINIIILCTKMFWWHWYWVGGSLKLVVAHFRNRIGFVQFMNFILRRYQKLIESNCESLQIIQIQVDLSHLLLFVEFYHLCTWIPIRAFVASFSFLTYGLLYIVRYSEVAQDEPVLVSTPQNILRFYVLMDDMQTV